MKPTRRASILGIFVSLSLPLAGQSTWNGTTSANWSVSTNWTPNAVPAGGVSIIIADTTPNGLTLNDGARSVGSITIGTTGTRTSGFTLNTTTANTLTISGGVVANGNFTAGIGARIRGNTTISADQTWQVGGQAGDHAADRGIAFNEVASSGVAGSVLLSANLNKFGTGQLTMGAVNVSGSGDINVNDGSLKLNAGGSLPLTLGGTGKIVVNNTAMLILSQNSGSFVVSRPIQFNLGAKLVTGSGSNTKTGDFTIGSDMQWNGIHTITNNNDANNAGDVRFLFTGVMSGTGTITKTGPRLLELGGTSSNTISTDITVAGGELRLNKTGAIAVPGNILVTGGVLRVAKNEQITDTSSITVTGGTLGYTAARTETIAALYISSGATSSLSGFNVTGATTITAGLHQLNSGETFSTHGLSISNNAAVQLVGAATLPASSTVNIGAGGLTLSTGRLLYGNPGNASTTQVNLAGNVISTGTSLFSPANYSGGRILDLHTGSRSFAVNDGTLDIQTTVQNGTLVKSGAGTLILSRTGSTADFSFTEGPVRIGTQINGGNINLSGGSLLMDIGGATPTKITTSADFTSTGGTIEISANNGVVTPGTIELVRYNGTLVGTPVIYIPAELVASRMNPVIDYGTGSNSAITLNATAVPLGLIWHGANGGIWDNKNTLNFNSGSEKFFPLDSVTFDDTGVNPSILLDVAAIPTAVTFSHGATVSTYTLAGTGSISGPTKLTKSGTGTTILATDNDYTGVSEVLEGVLQVGSGGTTGSLGSGSVLIDLATTLRFSRDGSNIVGNLFTGTGTIQNNGPGTTILTSNSTGFLGSVSITGGSLQFGDGGADGSIASAPVNVAAGSSLTIKRSGSPTIPNSVSGDGAITISSGSPILTGFNNHTGGVTVTDGGHLRVPADSALGDFPVSLIANAIRLNMGGLKNQDSDTVTDIYRGVTISGEAYFTAGWAKTLTINGPITGTGNVFINYDSGRVLFSDPTSNWSGILTLGSTKPGATGTTGGNLEINTINNGGAAGPLGMASADPANLVFEGGRLIYNGESASSNRGLTLLTAGTIDVTYSTLTMSGLLTGPGNFVKAGAGTLILSDNNDFLGTKNISGGSLVMRSTNALGSTASLLSFTGTTGILELATDTSVAPYPVTIGAGNSGTILSGLATAGAGINHTMGNLALSTVTLNVAASADVTSGNPRVTFGALNLAAGASGTTTLNPTTADITIGSASIESSNVPKTLSLGGSSQENLVASTIADGLNTVTLRKDNDSIWTVSGDNTFSGNVIVDDGVLAINHTNALGATTKTLSITGDAATNRIPELRLSGGIAPTVSLLNISGAGLGASFGALRNMSGDNSLTVTTQVNMTTGNGNTALYSDAGNFTLNCPLIAASAANRTLILGGSGNGLINGVIANGTTANLPITKNGSGTWTLTGTHTYTGATTVNEGVLSLSQAALDDASTVSIANGATLNLNFSGTDQVGSLTINGALKGNGVYTALTDPGFITGTGSIRVGAGGYDSWKSGFAFTVGANDGPGDDPDGDGISNLLEYVLGGIPIGTGAANTSILPSQTLTATNLILTFKRSDLSEADVTLKVQWSDNLATWNDFATIGAVDTLPAVDITEDAPNPDFDTVVVAIPKSTTPGVKLFARVQAVK